MKRILGVFAFLLCVLGVAFSQNAPQTMSYQAVVRDANGQLCVNKQVAVVVSLVQNNILGDVVYTESHSVTTNANGLMTLEIGQNKSFNDIDWANGPYYIKTETEVNGSVIEATSQLLSVPYAKYAETAGNMDDYVTKSEIDKYVDQRTREVIAYIFKNSALKSKTEDGGYSEEVFFETLQELASDPENLKDASENDFEPIEESELNGESIVKSQNFDSENDDSQLLSAEDCGIEQKFYNQLTKDPNNWDYQLGDFIGYYITGKPSYINAVYKYGKDSLKHVMEENLSNDYEKWESTSTNVYSKDYTMEVLTELLEEDFDKYKDIAGANSRLGKDKVEQLLKEWTEEDYDSWSETARKELGDAAVDKILEDLLEEDYDKYVEKAKTENNGAVYQKYANKGVNADGSIEAIFSISETEKIKFSRGNLQYQASTKTWRFAENQFDAVAGNSDNHAGENGGNVYVGSVKCDNINVSSSYSGWIDLFAWGTSGKQVSGYDYTAYLPYSVSGDVEDYFPGESLSGTQADWGTNSISNGSGKWRTLTHEEWDYLYQNCLENSRFGCATITTKHGSQTIEIQGFVLLTEGWKTPNGISFVANTNSFGSNKYTESQWFKMQANGAVFFPASGVRKISDKSSRSNKVWLTSTKTYAAYWTATAQKIESANSYWFVESADKGVQQQTYTKTAGMCVRLVQDVK
ncbi:MAG: hypothetical protein MJ198_04515 [Bacteroidales bacterium]|nr:hypothetical protein [Bacteroidales bacterium]